MNDEAQSSRARLHHGNNEDEHVDLNRTVASVDAEQEEEDAQERERFAKERRLDAKRKRIRLLDDLRRELDLVVFMELLTIYHLDGSFFWLLVRAFIHASLLIPIPDRNLDRPPDEPKPFLVLILLSFCFQFFLHLVYPAPSAGEDTRGYLHGGLVIDFIGQQGPTPKWKLLGLDTCVLMAQLVMATVHVKRRELKKKLAQVSGGDSSNTQDAASAGSTQEQQPPSAPTNTAEATNENAARGQDADSEERGVLRRTDTLSDIAADVDEEDGLLPPSDSGHVDALDLLTAGQCVIGEFTLIDTLVHDYKEYKEARQLQTGSGSSAAFSSDTLRQMQAIRMRLGVGGG